MKLAHTEHWRENNEEQRNKYENYAEEERDGESWSQLLLIPDFISTVILGELGVMMGGAPVSNLFY